MKGVVVLGNRTVEERELPIPEPGHGQVRVRATRAGVCGSDLHPYRAEPGPQSGKFVQGHELVGVVDRVGPGVEHVAEGDRVFVYLGWGCGHCPDCVTGYPNLCADRRDQGRMDRYQKEYSVVTESMVYRLPEAMSWDDAIMLTCAGGTAWAALLKAAPTCDDVAVVYGLGPVGLMGVLWAKAMGAYVIGVERTEERQALARQAGADVVLDAADDDLVVRVRGITAGEGATVGLECSGSLQAKDALLQTTSRAARVVHVAAGVPGATIDPSPFGVWGHLALRTVRGTVTYGLGDWYRMAKASRLHGLKPGQLVTHRFATEQASEAYALVDSARSGKVVFAWDV